MSDPSIVRPIWTPSDAQQTARDASKHVGVPVEVCGCESTDCAHGYLAVPAGDRVAMYVGGVCDDCADTHMAPYLITKGDR